MKLNIQGEMNLSYVQNLCLIFFPGAKFAQDEELTDETPIVDVSLTNEGDIFRAYCKMTLGEKSESAEAVFDRSGENGESYSADRAGKIAVGKAFYSAGGKLFDYQPPWGILTGIRPAKMAANYYSELHSKLAVRRVLVGDYLLSPKKARLVTDIAVAEQKTLSRYGLDTCSLYISVPFCPTRCAYCSFVSYSTKRLISLIPDYLVRVMEDIETTAKIIKEKGQKVVSVYIGGGTPTMLSAKELSMLLSKIRECIDFSTVEEFTLEGGRPDTFTEEKLIAIKEAGVTRISVNPQTLCDDILRGIGRAHTSEDFFRAFEMTRKVGIPCINTDVIAGLPGDSFPGFSKTMDGIVALRPENITVHTFSVKTASDILHSGVNVYSRSSIQAVKCVDYSQVVTLNSGYSAYYLYRQKNTVGNLENVGFTLPGFAGLYNSLIMSDQHNIYAVGASAVTKLIGENGPKRFFCPKYPYEYLDATKEKREEFFRSEKEFGI